jgi:hypothetical protein
VLIGTGPGPKFGGSNRREQDQCVGRTQFHPPGYNGRVSGSRYLNQDVGIRQEWSPLIQPVEP